MKFNLITVFILSFLSFKSYAQIDTTSLSSGQKFYLQSEIGNESIEAWIRLPSYFDEVRDSVSLLILLDGDEYFKIASDIAELYEWSDKMPPTVIIGLPSTTQSRWKYFTPTHVLYEGKPNQRDSLIYTQTGNFDKFADILSKELIPQLSTFLKASFISKTIFGHSNGGLGVMSFYTLRPEVFDNYIAASPAILWDDYFLQKQLVDKKRQNRVYMTLGTKGWDYKVETFEPIKSKLNNTNENCIFIENKQEGHSTNGLRTLLDGLEYIYRK